MRGNLNLLFAGLVVTIISGGFLALTARTNINELIGPAAMTPREVVTVGNPSKRFRYYVSTVGSGVGPSIYQEMRDIIDRKSGVVTSREVVNEIQLMQLTDKYILIRRLKASSDKGIAGALINVPEDLTQLVKQLKSKPEINAHFLPLMIDSTRFNWGGYATLILLTPLLLAGLVAIYLATVRLIFTAQNPTIKSLKRLGDPLQLLKQIENELADTDNVYHTSMFWLTENWILTAKLSGLEIRNTKELVWAYAHTSFQSVSYGIPVNKTQSIFFCDAQGKTASIWVTEPQMDVTIAAIRAKAPWAFFGDDPSYHEMWKKDKRAAMIAEVKTRQSHEES